MHKLLNVRTSKVSPLPLDSCAKDPSFKDHTETKPDDDDDNDDDDYNDYDKDDVYKIKTTSLVTKSTLYIRT
jgi:hypothetical protein